MAMQNNWESPEALKALEAGNVKFAAIISGIEYAVKGVVVHGNHLGRTLGFPTANLKLEDDCLFVAAYGVYAVKVQLEQQILKGIANAGFRPTVDGSEMRIEVHLLDYSGDLYGKTIVVYFVDRIRDEKKFNSLEELKNQIKMDVHKASELLP
jgi:riboflavin kinase/FMN adenylyltransferase